MDEGERALRNLTYRLFVDLGRAPTAADVAGEAAVSENDVRAAWSRLHDAHALVLHTEGGEIKMANPFAADRTAFRVEAAGRSWYANCAWDAFGICAALHSDGHIETMCHDCGDPIVVDVHEATPSDPTLLFHTPVPAARWWDDISFT